MDGWGVVGKFLRFIYTQTVVRFSGQIRNPYLIKIDSIYPDAATNELCVSFHIANKRVEQELTVAKFVTTDMIYMIDPRVVFDMGHQFGSYSEKLLTTNKSETSLKNKCIVGLKRVFVDE